LENWETGGTKTAQVSSFWEKLGVTVRKLGWKTQVQFPETEN
jgi:hypothetical protein